MGDEIEIVTDVSYLHLGDKNSPVEHVESTSGIDEVEVVEMFSSMHSLNTTVLNMTIDNL